MMGREVHEDVRERTVSSLMRRAEVDQQNADQVESMAMLLFEKAAQEWHLTETDRDLLRWASRLHEVGLSVAHTQFHKHGQYLIEHSDLPGFSKQMQWILALLVRSHRQKFPTENLVGLDKAQVLYLKKLCAIMRLAAVFKYVTAVEGEPLFSTTVQGSEIVLGFDEGWLERHPLTSDALSAERQVLKKIGFQLRFNGI